MSPHEVMFSPTTCYDLGLLRGFCLSGQAIPLYCLPDRFVVGRGDIAEGLYELAAVHHKGLVELIKFPGVNAGRRIFAK